HGLGKQVSGDLTPAQMVKAASLDWTVSKRRLYMQGLTDKDDDLVVPGFFALTRDSDSKVLDIVGPQYVPTQNIEAFSFFDNFVKAGGATMETAGSLRGGKMVWGLAKLKRIGP